MEDELFHMKTLVMFHFHCCGCISSAISRYFICYFLQLNLPFSGWFCVTDPPNDELQVVLSSCKSLCQHDRISCSKPPLLLKENFCLGSFGLGKKMWLSKKVKNTMIFVLLWSLCIWVFFYTAFYCEIHCIKMSVFKIRKVWFPLNWSNLQTPFRNNKTVFLQQTGLHKKNITGENITKINAFINGAELSESYRTFIRWFLFY